MAFFRVRSSQNWAFGAGMKLFLAVLTLFFVFGSAQAQDKKKSAPPASLVFTDNVTSQTLSQTVPVIGRLVAKDSGEVSTRIDGYIASYKVDIGDKVKKGDTLAVLDTEVLRAQLRLAESEAKQAQASLKAAQARAKLARQSLKRYTDLRNSPAYSRARVEDQRQNLNEAVALMSEARATIEEKKVMQSLRRLDIKYASIKAPFSGVVTEKSLSAGSYARTGTAIVRLVSDSALEIEADVPYQRVAGLKPGLKIDFKLDDGTQYKSNVRAVLPSENPTTRTRIVRFIPDFGAEAKQLANAQSVVLNIPLSAARKVITVHKDAILQKKGEPVIFVFEKGKAVLKKVRLGEGIGHRVEVLSGLKENDLAIIRGNERLTPGAAVRVNGAKPAAGKKPAGTKK